MSSGAREVENSSKEGRQDEKPVVIGEGAVTKPELVGLVPIAIGRTMRWRSSNEKGRPVYRSLLAVGFGLPHEKVKEKVVVESEELIDAKDEPAAHYANQLKMAAKLDDEYPSWTTTWLKQHLP